MKIKRWHIWLGIAVSAVFLWFAFQKVDFALVWEQLKSANLAYVALGIFFYFITLILRTWRWQLLLLPIKKLPLKGLFSILSAGYMGNNIFPARAGDVLRTVLLRKNDEVPISGSLATIIVEKLFDGISILMLVFLNLKQLTQFASNNTWIAFIEKSAFWAGLAFVLILLVFLGMVLMPEKAEQLSGFLVDRLLPEKIRKPIKGIISKFTDGLKILRSPLQSLLVMAISIAIWVVEAGLYWGVLKAMGFELNFQSILLTVGIVNLVLLIPAAPGGLGTFDAATKAMMEGFGFNPSDALSYALMLRVALWLPVTLLGAFFFVKEGFSLSSDLKSMQEEYKEEDTRQHE